jgi:hypothetical protein
MTKRAVVEEHEGAQFKTSEMEIDATIDDVGC